MKSNRITLLLILTLTLVVRSGNVHAQGGYANVNGLKIYYEVHGSGQPLVLIHGAFSAIGSSFGGILPELAKTRQVIGVELQGHGRTGDIGRPLTMKGMAADVAALIEHLKLKSVDVYGYSMGAGVAMELAYSRPDLVRKLIFSAAAFNPRGFYPGFLDMMAGMKAENLIGSPWHDEYMKLSPDPKNFPKLFEKVMTMTAQNPGLTPEQVAKLKAPTLILAGDSDILTPEHAVEMFRLLGGGKIGDVFGLPNSQLAILPGTTHSQLKDKHAMLLAVVSAFLDAPITVTK